MARIPRSLIAAVAIVAGFSTVMSTWAAEDELHTGDAVITQFSGAYPTQTADALTQWRIDPDGIVAKVINLQAPDFNVSGEGQQSTRPLATAAEVGQVFGIATDDATPPNIYLAATSIYGLARTGDGWMEGQWGLGGGPGTIWRLDAANGYAPEIFANVELDGRANTGAGIGNIAFDPYHRQLIVSDLETGMIHAFGIDDAEQRDRFDHGVQARSGFIDVARGEAKALPIVEFDTASGARTQDCDADAFATSPQCWNLADFRRRVWGVGIQRDERTAIVRVFYALWSDVAFSSADFADALPEEKTNAVWSVELDENGRFEPATAQLEFLVPGKAREDGEKPDHFAISDIAFPKTPEQKVMLIARHRGVITSAGELAERLPWSDMYSPAFEAAENQRWVQDDGGKWSPLDEYVETFKGASMGEGKAPERLPLGENVGGGTDFGFGYRDGRIDENAPAGFAWHTVNAPCAAPGSCAPEVEPFGEEFPAWNRPDLAIDTMETDPLQAVPGNPVVISATVANRGTGPSADARLDFTIDGEPAESVDVRALAAGESISQRISWTADTPGLHRIQVEIVPASGQVEGDNFNNRADRRLWVAGEPQPKSDLVFELPAGNTVSTGVLALRAANPSFATIEAVDATVWLDGERNGSVKIGPIYPSNSTDIQIDLGDVIPGEHMVALEADWSDNLFDRDLRAVVGWHITIPGPGQQALTLTPGTWLSLGPSILVKGQPDGSQGRIDHLVVHPTNSNILYASAVRGGLWRSTDGGDNWSQLTDDLSKQFGTKDLRNLIDASPLKGGAIALDPGDPDIIYYGTGSSRYRGGLGIYKSVDGGGSWHQIADEALTRGVSELHVERRADGGVTVYAATDAGLLRLVGADPKAIAIMSSDWTTIQGGQVDDMAVDPDDTGRVYIAVLGPNRPRPGGGDPVQVMDGLYRCTDMDGASPSCTQLTTDLPAMDTNSSIRIDVFPKDTKKIYTSIVRISAFDAAAPRLAIYRSEDRGDTWTLKASFDDSSPNKENLYNPYIRVHPENPSIVWFGGVNLFKLDLDDTNAQATKIQAIHDDQHGLTFEPAKPDMALRYYVVGDGGVWRCAFKPAQDDICENRNYDLRVMEFFDIDVAENEPSLIVGGTQDNGTQVFNGSPEWNQAYQPRGGDGAYTPMSPANHNVVISQHQLMHSDAEDGKYSTWISVSGPKNPWIWGLAGSADIPDEIKERSFFHSYITFRPGNPDFVAIAGEQIYASDNATDFTMDGNIRRSAAIWSARGPEGKNVHGRITRIIFQPDTGTWYAGTTEGQVWRSDHGIQTTWKLIWERDHDKASVVSMAFAPTDRDVLYVLYSGGDPYRRVLRLQGLSSGVTGTPMGNNLPENREWLVISGDGYSADRVYVGTDKGVFQGDVSRPTYDQWKPYNNGLPAIRINDLVVPTGRRNQAAPTTGLAPERRLFAATRGRGVWVVDPGP
jgi:CARDB